MSQQENIAVLFFIAVLVIGLLTLVITWKNKENMSMILGFGGGLSLFVIGIIGFIITYIVFYSISQAKK